MKDKEKNEGMLVLEEICSISNLFYIEPKRVVGIYNRVVSKRYSRDVRWNLDVTYEYIRLHYNRRDASKKKWGVEEQYCFQKKSKED